MSSEIAAMDKPLAARDFKLFNLLTSTVELFFPVHLPDQK
jgi:hypothetical protein